MLSHYDFTGAPTTFLTALILLVGAGAFTFIIKKRLEPLFNAAPDYRLHGVKTRFKNTFTLWLAQSRQPRYLFAGILHIAIFFGFLVLMTRTLSMAVIGLYGEFTAPSADSVGFYALIKDYTATLVFIACVMAAIRRGVFTPNRYKESKLEDGDHKREALIVLATISALMLLDALFEASYKLPTSPLTLTHGFASILGEKPDSIVKEVQLIAYFAHNLLFFYFLCSLPFGKHFHVFTSLFNVFFMKNEKGTIKPVLYGVDREQLDELESFGVKKMNDFTWKHMLDFYSCADCGRCSDQCPANRAGRALSPRALTVKARELLFKSYPIFGKQEKESSLIGKIYSEEEIWSCTTCGACERECPLGIEYIDKIVDMRRGMIEEGNVPKSLHKPLQALERRGNPWGKPERKRLDWAKDKEFAAEVEVKSLEKGGTAETLFFVDSVSSYEDRMQNLTRDTARVLSKSGVDYGVLGKLEKDSGNEVKRIGEEMLFQDLKEQNTEAIENAEVKNIVTADPHAYNALKNEYEALPPVKHVSQVFAEKIRTGEIELEAIEEEGKTYTYHDPCYLGRHNELYDAPREVIGAIPGIDFVEMKQNKDRAFCCGGGGLTLFQEHEEETRMGVTRIEMAKEAGANVIVTACPFCLMNLEDAIKVAGMEGELEAIDLTELVNRQLKQ